MNVIRKVVKWVFICLLSLGVLLVLADTAWNFVPQWLAQRTVTEVDQYAQPLSSMDIPDDASIIGLGEATHGNVEFQELKLSVLKNVVEKEGVRAFALEADFSEALAVNDYIHGEDGNATDLVKNFSFTIYRTKQMAELLEWMRDYNAGKPASSQVSFYGFDMQNPEKGVDWILAYCQQHHFLSDANQEAVLARIKDTSKSVSKEEMQQAEEVLKSIQSTMATREKTRDSQLAARVITCMLNAFSYYQLDSTDYVAMNNARDQYMAENVAWIQSFQAQNGHGRILIAGHNGHVGYKEQFYTTMGSHLKEQYQKGYFVIGTDYFDTVVNIKAIGKGKIRENHHFNSADPLAAQADRMGGNYYLDFSTVQAGGQTDTLLSNPMSMGSLGEGYGFLMLFLPNSHRVQQIPKELYDAMVFFYKISPIEPLTK